MLKGRNSLHKKLLPLLAAAPLYFFVPGKVYALAPQAFFSGREDENSLSRLNHLRFFGIPLSTYIDILRSTYPNYETDPKQMDHLTQNVFQFIQRHLKNGEDYSIESIMKNQGVNCVGYATVTGYIFRELGIPTFWLNVIDNADLNTEGHAAIMIKTPGGYKLVDPAMNILHPVPLTAGLSSVDLRTFEKGLSHPVTFNFGLDAETRKRANLLKLNYFKSGLWRSALRQSLPIHPTFQILPFEEGQREAVLLHEAEKLLTACEKRNPTPDLLKEAEIRINAALSINPDNPFSKNFSADIFSLTGDLKKSESTLTGLIAKFPEHPIFLMHIGDFYLEHGRIFEARQIFEKYMDYSFNLELLLNLAQVHILSGSEISVIRMITDVFLNLSNNKASLTPQQLALYEELKNLFLQNRTLLKSERPNFKARFSVITSA